ITQFLNIHHGPVSEKPCEVKIKSYGPIDPTPVPEGEESTDDVEKAKCKLKDTKYRKLTAKEIVRDPRFFVEGATRFDIQQGELGDCWLLAAIATLTLNPKLFHFIVPCDQGFYYKYAGIFHFRFWQYGRWQDVYVDDLLPTYRGRLVFMHSKTKNEFWCALLEKAYANEDERDKLGITFDDDGEFWMPFKDFISNFTAMDICDVTPDVFTSQLDCDSDDEECIVKEQRHRQWKMRVMEGEWIQGKTAGGCRNFLDTFHLNPQKVVLLDRPDDDDPDNCTLVVSVMQKYVRQRKRYGIDYIPIGFAVYKEL
ncbi:Calpain-B, partial [Armadillidium nasatum]